MSFTQKIQKYCQSLFSQRTILIVTDKKIRTIKIGIFSQIFAIIFLSWVTILFVQSLRYDEIIQNKSKEISRLESVNEYFDKEVDNVNEKLRKINEYLVSIANFEEKSEEKEVEPNSEIKDPKNIENDLKDDLSKNDLDIINRISFAEEKIANIQIMTQSRIKKIQDAILVTGLNLKKIPTKDLIRRYKKSNEKIANLANIRKSRIGQGGPEVDNEEIDKEIEAASSKDDLDKKLETVKFLNEVDHLIILEKIANSIPFSHPMKDYYISSGFGPRIDPVTGRLAAHKGLDFVGEDREKVISPSRGRVILAGKYSGYGNAIVIDHGFGITTRYGHLSKVKVKKGQIVNRGDVIALQGNSGRSTGAHLHYEVRYKNDPLDPQNFLKAGQFLFNKEI